MADRLSQIPAPNGVPTKDTHAGSPRFRRDGGLVLTRTVVITGGSSGLGRCTAALYARRGWRVGLIARGAEGLEDAAHDVRAAGTPVATAVADVVDSAALAAAAASLAAALGPIDVWINCAGNGVYGRFADVSEAEFQRVTDVTYHGTVNGVRVAMAHMAPRGHGAIVNVCSAVAFHGLPLMSSYAGAKAAIRGFSQALRGELTMQGSRLRVSTVFPPAVNTPFFSHAISHMGWPARPARPLYQPEVVAEGIYLAAETGRAEVTISGTAVLFSFMTRLAPDLIAFLMTKMDMDRQITRDPAACGLVEPTVFIPSRIPSGMHGAFGHEARRRSTQVWLMTRWARLAGWLRAGFARGASVSGPSAAVPSASPSRSARDAGAPGPAPADSAARPGAS